MIFISTINFELSFLYVAQYHSFACSYLAVSALFVKRLFFTPLNCLGKLVRTKLFLNKCEVLFLDSQFCSFDLYVCLMPLLHLHDCSRFVIRFKICKCEFSNSAFLFQDCFGHFAYLEFLFFFFHALNF